MFAAGNVLHGAETADVAALDGRHVAAAVARHLGGGEWPTARVPIRCEPPLGWIAPNAVDAREGTDGVPPRSRFLLRAAERLDRPRVEISQEGRQLWAGRLRWLDPGRSMRVPASWTAAVEPNRGAVTVRVRA